MREIKAPILTQANEFVRTSTEWLNVSQNLSRFIKTTNKHYVRSQRQEVNQAYYEKQRN